MVKYLFILINSLSLLVYGFFFGDGGVTITSTIPAAIQPGKTVDVELRIAKGTMSGFAKMQLDLPAGLTVNEIDSKGANFSYVDGIAKWVWASLPSENEIVIKLALVADPGASGKVTIGGKYSYVENNGKQVVEMTPVEVTIGDAVAANTTTNSATTESTSTSSDNSSSSTTTTEPATTTGNSSGNTEPAGNITFQRVVSKIADGEYLVSIKINKGVTKGFARYSDDLPEGISAKAEKTEGASFSVADVKVKFVWVAVPEKEELLLSYILSGVKSPLTLNGEYSYLEQNQSKKYNPTPETITPESTMAVNTNTTSTENNTAGTNTTSAETNTTSNTESTAKNTATTTNESNQGNDSNSNANETLPKKDGNVSFMVQIGAFTNSQVSASRLSKKFKISESIKSEMSGGYSKFMVGEHNAYKSARDHREKMRNNNGVATAFVVAYNTGKRITVQEALMITSQKWFK